MRATAVAGFSLPASGFCSAAVTLPYLSRHTVVTVIGKFSSENCTIQSNIYKPPSQSQKATKTPPSQKVTKTLWCKRKRETAGIVASWKWLVFGQDQDSFLRRAGGQSVKCPGREYCRAQMPFRERRLVLFCTTNAIFIRLDKILLSILASLDIESIYAKILSF
eukprot:g29668.t1